MEFLQALRLIEYKKLNRISPQTWADLGSGQGLFSKALLGLLAPGSIVYAIDKAPAHFESLNKSDYKGLIPVKADFEKDPLGLDPLDGILMANAFHFVKNKDSFLDKMETHLISGGVFLVVEYDMDRPNSWVPFPINYERLQKLFQLRGYQNIRPISRYPSRYNNSDIYSVWIER